MAVLFAKLPVRHEVVNDRNGDLTNVAWVLQSPRLRGRLLSRLHDTIASESHFRRCRANLIDAGPPSGEPDWQRAYYAMVTWWLGRNGMAGVRKSRTNFSARFTSRGGSGGVRFRNMVESIPAFCDRLARVDVLNRCGFEVLERIADKPRTAIYCDPPYLKKSFAYEYDFAAADHQRLADAASRFRNARVVISYYDHPRLEGLYPPAKWRRVAIEVNKAIRNTDTRNVGAVKATEILLVNDGNSASLAGA